MKRYFTLILILIGITSVFWNVKYQLRIEKFLIEKSELITEIKEKDQLIEDYQFGISQMQIIDECYIGE